MGRVIGDGGWYFTIAEVVTGPPYQGRGLGRRVLSEQALADVLAAVEASTAVNTKAAYRSDWARFTGWAGEQGSRRCRRIPWSSRIT